MPIKYIMINLWLGDQKMLETNKPKSEKKDLKSFLEIITKQKSLNIDESFESFKSFILKNNSSFSKHVSNEISLFWKEHDAINSKEKDMISWIPNIEEKKAKFFQQASSRDDNMTVKKNYYYKNISNYKKVLKINDFSIFEQLNKDFPNFKEVTEFYQGSFFLNSHRKDQYRAPSAILLLGEPGIGKTHYAKNMAKILNTTMHFLDTSSISAGWVLSGINGTWQDADAGKIFQAIHKSQSISPIFVLDELDKMTIDQKYSISSVLHQLFERKNAESFYDEFLELDFDASKIIYILTANSIKNIPDSLFSRLQIFDIKKPDDAQMKNIIQTIYKDILGESTLFTDELKDEEVDKLVHLSPREVDKIISDNIYTQSANLVNKNNEKAIFRINKNKNVFSTSIGFN